MKHGSLQGPLNDMIVQRSSRLMEEQGQASSMFQAVSNR